MASYTDFGSKSVWVEAHQGGSFSAASRARRFFTGTDEIRACLGSEYFRINTQMAISPDSLGEIIQDEVTSAAPGNTVIAPIGIVEDENNETGRYFFLHYVDVGGTSTPSGVFVYDSPYDGELPSGTGVLNWDHQIPLPKYVEKSCRVVNIGFTSDSAEKPGRTFLYYILSSASASKIYVVQLPDPGDPASTEAPKLVASLSFLVDDRIYAVPSGDGLVTLYVGDHDPSHQKRTHAIVHDPKTNTVIRPEKIVAQGSIPFSRSYGACVGREYWNSSTTVVLLEADISWNEGGSFLPQARVAGLYTQGPGAQAETGSSWTVAIFSGNGYTLEDSVRIDSGDVFAWMGSTYATSLGGLSNVSVVPTMISRVGRLPEDLASKYGGRAEFDVSISYAVHFAVRPRVKDPVVEDVFVFRKDFSDIYNPAFGNNRITATPDHEVLNILGGPNSFRGIMGLLTPGTFEISAGSVENSQGFSISDGSVANRLDSWRVTDDNNASGEPGTPSAPSPPQNPSADTVHGVKASLISADRVFIVGWFHTGVL